MNIEDEPNTEELEPICDCYPEHCTHGNTCWCEPKIEIVEGTKIIIHNEAN